MMQALPGASGTSADGSSESNSYGPAAVRVIVRLAVGATWASIMQIHPHVVFDADLASSTAKKVPDGLGVAAATEEELDGALAELVAE